MSRISRRQLSESQHLYRESGMVNCFLPRSRIPDPPPVRSHTNEKVGRVTRLSCCGVLPSHRLHANLNSMHWPVGQEVDGKEAG